MTLATPAPAHRNAPCPCGSGLRYKHCCGMQRDAMSTRERAFEAQQYSRLIEAERLYREVLAADPNDLDSLHMLGRVQLRQLRHREALDALWTTAEYTRWAVDEVVDDVCLAIAALIAPQARARERELGDAAFAQASDETLRESVTRALAAPPDLAMHAPLLRFLFANGRRALVPIASIRALALELRALPEAAATPQKMTGRTAIVVLGMHRSGTSALTRVLNLCGATLPATLVPPHPEENPTGFWEPRDLVAFDERVLCALGGSWSQPPAPGPLPDALADEFDRAIARFLANELGAHELVVLKDPRIALLADPWDRALRANGFRVVYVVPVRHPLEVARSLHARGDIDQRDGVALWLAYMGRIVAFARVGRQVAFVRSSDVVDAWRDTMRAIARRLDVSLDTRAHAEEIDAFLAPALRRQSASPADLDTADPVRAEADTLYAQLLARCERMG